MGSFFPAFRRLLPRVSVHPVATADRRPFLGPAWLAAIALAALAIARIVALPAVMKNRRYLLREANIVDTRTGTWCSPLWAGRSEYRCFWPPDVLYSDREAVQFDARLREQLRQP